MVESLKFKFFKLYLTVAVWLMKSKFVRWLSVRPPSGLSYHNYRCLNAWVSFKFELLFRLCHTLRFRCFEFKKVMIFSFSDFFALHRSHGSKRIKNATPPINRSQNISNLSWISNGCHKMHWGFSKFWVSDFLTGFQIQHCALWRNQIRQLFG